MIFNAPGRWWGRRNIGDVFYLVFRKDNFQKFNENVFVHFAAEEQFEGPIHHRIDVPRLDSFIHCQMIQAAIVFHRVCLDLYSPEPAIPTILNQ